jgi:hypothetical protein
MRLTTRLLILSNAPSHTSVWCSAPYLFHFYLGLRGPVIIRTLVTMMMSACGPGRDEAACLVTSVTCWGALWVGQWWEYSLPLPHLRSLLLFIPSSLSFLFVWVKTTTLTVVGGGSREMATLPSPPCSSHCCSWWFPRRLVFVIVVLITKTFVTCLDAWVPDSSSRGNKVVILTVNF